MWREYAVRAPYAAEEVGHISNMDVIDPRQFPSSGVSRDLETWDTEVLVPQSVDEIRYQNFRGHKSEMGPHLCASATLTGSLIRWWGKGSAQPITALKIPMSN